MYLSTVAILYGATLAVAVTTTLKACTQDNCLRAVIGSAFSTRHGSADCGSYLITTVTPATVTNTATVTVTATTLVITDTFSATATITPTTTLQGVQKRSAPPSNEYPYIHTTAAVNARQVVVIPSPIPGYASACSGASRYSSACSCIGISQSTITVSAPSAITTTTIFTTTTTTTSLTTTISTATAPAATAYSGTGFYSIGCYEDVKYDYFGFTGASQSTPLTLHECAQLCVDFTYFGLYAGADCVCGNSGTELTLQDDQSFCNLPCAGDPTTFCGGGYNSGANGYPAWGIYQKIS